VCDLRRRFDVSIMLVTHDLAAVAPHADRMVFVRQTVLAEGRPQEVLANNELIMSLGSNMWAAARLTDSLKEGDQHDRSML